jgi:uncharacterized OB-fold protein
MPLDAQQQQRFDAWFAKTHPNGKKCPVCGSVRWAPVHCARVNVMNGDKFAHDIAGEPLAMVTCSDCGNVRFFMTGVLP